jgi:hypothetical protein
LASVERSRTARDKPVRNARMHRSTHLGQQRQHTLCWALSNEMTCDPFRNQATRTTIAGNGGAARSRYGAWLSHRATSAAVQDAAQMCTFVHAMHATHS